MKKKHTKEQKRVTILSAALCFAVLLFLYAVYAQWDIANEKERGLYLCGNLTGNIEKTIDSVMLRVDTMKALIQSHDGNSDWFEKASYDIFKSVADETGISLKNIAIAPGGVVTKVYPMEGNESLVGFNFLEEGRVGNYEAKLAYERYERNETILTNPFELIQGGIGMAGRSPVILRDSKGGQRLWGLVTVTIDCDNLIKELELDSLHRMGLNYRLSYLDNVGDLHPISSSGDVSQDAVVRTFSVRNLNWQIEVEPIGGWMRRGLYLFSLILILIISGFAGAFANMLIQLRENNVMLIRISSTDRLTGCLNRRAYEDALAGLEEKKFDKKFVYVSIDVNGLKTVNDNLGHMAGDELICGAAECMQKALGTYGEVYRIGGDEFVGLLSVDMAIIPEIMETLRVTIDEWEGEIVDGLSVSVGFVSWREFPDSSVQFLVKTADDRMYASKSEYYRKKGIDRRAT